MISHDHQTDTDMPGLFGGSRRHTAVEAEDRNRSGRLLSILTVPLARRRAPMKIQGMPVPTPEPEMRGGTHRETGLRRPDWQEAA
jgi:hypothetical protein